MGALLVHGQFLGRSALSSRAAGFICAELEATVPEDEVATHTHAEGHFVLVRSGHYVSTAQGAPEVAGAGLVLYNPPGTTHRDRFRGAGGRFFTVSVACAELERLRGAASLPDRAVALGADSLRLATELADQVAHADASQLELESLGTALVDSVAVRFRRALAGVPPWLLRARELFFDAAAADHRLAAVAAEVGVHPVHLVRAFRGHFGLTPGAFLRRLRLNRAAALLRSPRLALVEVGLRSGYHDQAHFSRSFKRAFGVAPREYRRRS